jgi:hypothetical protein
MSFVPSSLLTLSQVLDRLTEAKAPGMSRKVASERSELQQLEKTHAPLSRAPAPVSSIFADHRSTDIPQARRQLTLTQLAERARDSRHRLIDLRNNQFNLAAVREHAYARLGQALCDSHVQACLLVEATGETKPIPASMWSTRQAGASLKTGRLTLATQSDTVEGFIVLLADDITKWMAVQTASQAPAEQDASTLPTLTGRAPGVTDSAPMPTSAAAIKMIALPRRPAKKTGPKGNVTGATAQRIADDIKEGKHTLAELYDMKQEYLKSLYGVGSRDTVMNALHQAAAIVGNSNSDKLRQTPAIDK